MAKGSNEIPAAQGLLRRTPIEDCLALVDAMHAQSETARVIVQEGGGDCLMTVKGSQPGVVGSVQQLHRGLQRAFSPSTAAERGGADGGTQSGAVGGAGAGAV